MFNNPFTWAEELGALLLIYLSFVTGDVVYKKNAHISIDYVVGFFPPRLRATTQMALAALTCICLASLMVVSLPLIHDQFGYTIAAALPLSKSWWTMPVPIVFLSMILTTINIIIHSRRAMVILTLEFAVLEPEHPVGDIPDPLVVRHNDHTAALLLGDLTQQSHDFMPDLGIEVRRRLVGQNQGRLVDERPRDRHSLFLSAR